MIMNEVYVLMGAVCIAGAWYTHWSNGKAYDRGLIDAIQMHNEGRLTYKSSYDDEGVEVLDIRIEPEDLE